MERVRSGILFLSLRALDRPLKIHSRALNAEFWLVPPDLAGRSFDAPVYTTTECLMLLLMNPAPAELKAIHLAKRILEGELSFPAGAEGLHGIYEELMARYRDLESRIGERPSREEESRLLSIAGRISRLLGCLPELEENQHSRSCGPGGAAPRSEQSRPAGRPARPADGGPPPDRGTGTSRSTENDESGLS